MSSLTSFTLTVSGYSSGTIDLSYDGLDFTPSATDSYKSTSGDVFKVFINGVRIYRQDDSIYASGNGFLEPTDNQTGNTLNNVTDSGTTNWGRTSNTVWVINTTANKVVLNPTQIAATALYGSTSPGLGITVSNGDIIELRRSVQDLKTPAVDFSNASILTEQDLDNSAKNVFHVAQQAVSDVGDALKYNTGTASYQSYVPGTSSNAKISNVATPTAANDAANKSYVDGSSNTVTVANNIANVNAVAGQITPNNNIATVAGISNDITAVANDATDIGTVAGKAAEIGRLGTADAVADMAILGTNDIVNDMNKLAHDDIVNDMNVLGTDANVTAMGHLGTSANVTNMSTIATGYDGTTSTSGTNTNLDNINTVATNMATIGAKVAKQGDTMTGALTLSGAPTADNHASTKAYTDSQATALALALG